MSTCRDFTSTHPSCRAIQIIEPDDTLLTSVAFGGVDESLEETGVTPLAAGQSRVSVEFETQKVNDVYRFEYLYVDSSDPSTPIQCRIIPVPISRSVLGFVVDMSGAALADDGYILRWRVVVRSEVPTISGFPCPSLRLQLPQARYSQLLVNPRASSEYGFSGLSVESLITTPNFNG
jgi:hypothetical protein